MSVSGFDSTIPILGQPSVPSPLARASADAPLGSDFTDDNQFVVYGVETHEGRVDLTTPASQLLEKAGPRRTLYFDPGRVHAGIVTCGGLCPGINNVIRALVMGLWYHYGVKQISGIRYGYRGFLPDDGLPLETLTPRVVTDIHHQGGTILGSSRGQGDRVSDIVDSMDRMNLNILFVIGGDGTQRGSLEITQEIGRRGLKMAVVGIPKTIDNDLSFIQKSFGFETAVSKAVDSVVAAHVEAQNAFNGIGVVKVMGRESGFIAAHTALAVNDVNFVLIPEVPFDLHGPNGLLGHLEERIAQRHHAVILVAEGAGQDHLEASTRDDESGNKKPGDIGTYLTDRIRDYFRKKQIEVSARYIDPSYIIRSAPANANDSIYCARLGTHAVHAAMAGKTGLLISLMHDQFVHVPIQLAVSKRHQIAPEKELWRDVVAATGQPRLMKNPDATLQPQVTDPSDEPVGSYCL